MRSVHVVKTKNTNKKDKWQPTEALKIQTVCG